LLNPNVITGAPSISTSAGAGGSANAPQVVVQSSVPASAVSVNTVASALHITKVQAKDLEVIAILGAVAAIAGLIGYASEQRSGTFMPTNGGKKY